MPKAPLEGYWLEVLQVEPHSQTPGSVLTCQDRLLSISQAYEARRGRYWELEASKPQQSEID
jgi:hypothetical protein